MIRMTKQEIEAGKAQLKAMMNERAEIEFEYLSAKDEMRDYGMYGQVPARVECAASDAGYRLQLWDEEHGVELRNLKSKFLKFIPVIHNQRL